MEGFADLPWAEITAPAKGIHVERDFRAMPKPYGGPEGNRTPVRNNYSHQAFLHDRKPLDEIKQPKSNKLQLLVYSYEKVYHLVGLPWLLDLGLYGYS